MKWRQQEREPRAWTFKPMHNIYNSTIFGGGIRRYFGTHSFEIFFLFCQKLRDNSLEILLSERVLVELSAAVQGRPLRLFLEQTHGFDVLQNKRQLPIAKGRQRGLHHKTTKRLTLLLSVVKR